MSGVIGAIAIAGEVLRWIDQLVAAGTDAVTAWSAVQKVRSENRAPSAEEWALVSDAVDMAHQAVQNATRSDQPLPQPEPTSTAPSDDMPHAPADAPPQQPSSESPAQPAPLGVHVLGQTPLGGEASSVASTSESSPQEGVRQSRGGPMPGLPFGQPG
jgi:hypothetical protein